MNCCWDDLLALLPPQIRCEAMNLNKEEQEDLREIRLRIGQKPQWVLGRGSYASDGQAVQSADLAFCVNHVSGFSAYAASGMEQGYLTAKGGHRIGLCGKAVVQQGAITSLKEINSLCVRVAKDLDGIAARLLAWADLGSMLIVGPPGSGKTTLLRDLIRQISRERQENVAVVDERCELFPMAQGVPAFFPGPQTDVLSGCPKAQGMEQVLRAMGPSWIAVDEITSLEDCRVMEACGYCGVSFLATAHGASAEDLRKRPVYRALMETGIFQSVVVMGADKTYRAERWRG